MNADAAFPKLVPAILVPTLPAASATAVNAPLLTKDAAPAVKAVGAIIAAAVGSAALFIASVTLFL
jgi:hypothetical protein